MKLLARYNRINLLVSITVLLLSSLCFYFMIRSVLLDKLDDDLKIEEQEITDYVKVNNSLPNPSNYKDQQVIFEAGENATGKKKFSSLDIFNKEEAEDVAVRQLEFSIRVAGRPYTTIIRKSQEETEDLVKMILIITLAVVALLLLLLFIINRFLLTKLWKPFNSTLYQLKQFNLSNTIDLQLEHTTINEFRELNESAKIMTDSVRRDYLGLKKFTENASHEMQTPLAIINSKLDVLIQDESVSENQMQQLQGIYDAMNRLSKLNQSLLLLTKIENNQFKEIEEIQLDKIISEKITQLEELIADKKLNITADLQSTRICFNKQLIDIIISNLLINAIRYNHQDGIISIRLSPAELVVANSSDISSLNDQKLFQRFYRHRDSRHEGNGLGLSIVKQICDTAGYSIAYDFKNGQHVFSIKF